MTATPGGDPRGGQASVTFGEDLTHSTAAPRSSLPVPEGLQAAGRACWDSIAGSYALRADEVLLLEQMARGLDELAAMRAALAEQGVMAQGSKGQPRPNPLLTEIRGARIVLARLAAQLALPDEEGEVGRKPSARKASLAARARWAAEEVPVYE